MSERLVPVNQYNPNIKELHITKRIEIEHPLLVRDTVAQKLATVANKLPKELQLQIDSGYRSRHSQTVIWEQRLKQNNGDIKKTSQLVFNPHEGTPPHSTGGAVDIALLDLNNNKINLSSPFSKFYHEPKLISSKIDAYAQKLRLLLNQLMITQNFAPNPIEYWHFSYGDESWSSFYNQKSIYEEIPSNEVPKYSQFYIQSITIRKLLTRIYFKLSNQSTNY